MSRQVSPSANRSYGVLRVTRVWGTSRATLYRHRYRRIHHPPARQHRHHHGAARIRILEHDIGRIAATLRPHPFLVKASSPIFIEIDEIRDADDLAVRRQDRQRIELRMGLGIELDVVRIGPAIIVRDAEFADQILGKQPAGLAADEVADAGDDVIPQRGIEAGIVDGLDQVGQLPWSVHGYKWPG